MSGQSVRGRMYRVNKVVFQVLEIEPYPKSKVSERYKEILELRPGVLAAISYRGTLIPNITLVNGVARLLRVKVGDKVWKTPKTISAALGVKGAMLSYNLKKL